MRQILLQILLLALFVAAILGAPTSQTDWSECSAGQFISYTHTGTSSACVTPSASAAAGHCTAAQTANDCDGTTGTALTADGCCTPNLAQCTTEELAYDPAGFTNSAGAKIGTCAAVTTTSCMLGGSTYSSTGPKCTAGAPDLATCFGAGLDFDNGNSRCAAIGGGDTADNKQSKANCFKQGLNWNVDHCDSNSVSTDNDVSLINCWKEGLNYLAGSPNKCQTASVNTDNDVSITNCWKNFLVFKTDRCYEHDVSGVTSLQSPIEADCFSYGFDFDSTNEICKKFTKCPVDSDSVFTLSASGTCKPVDNTVADLACRMRGLKRSTTSCVAETSCPNGWTTVAAANNHVAYCQPDSEKDCLNILMVYDTTNKRCDMPYSTALCQKLNSLLSISSDLTYCTFPSNVADDEKTAICLSFGMRVGGTNSDRCVTNAACIDSGDFTQDSTYGNLCYPKNKLACQNYVMGFTSTSTFCTYVINDKSACSSAGLYPEMTTGTIDWCVVPEVFDRCYLPNGGTRTCPSGMYYDTKSSEPYKCVDSVTDCSSTAQLTYNYNCLSSCTVGTYPTTSATATEGTCTVCPTGCSACNFSDDCTSCSSGYVLDSTATDGKGVCRKCSVSNCVSCVLDTRTTKCSSCDSPNFEKKTGEGTASDVCNQCIKNCDSCSNDDDAYLTYCTTCNSAAHQELDSDSKIIKCTCDIKYQNTLWRNNTKGIGDATEKYIENINTEGTFMEFYCNLYNYFKKTIPSSCDATVDTLLNAEEDNTILLDSINRVNALLDVSGSEFSSTTSNAYSYLKKFLSLDLAEGNVDAAVVNAALKTISNVNFTATIGNTVNLMNLYLAEFASADTQYTAFQVNIDAIFEKLNELLLKGSATSTLVDSTAVYVKFSQTQFSVLPTSATQEIQFNDDTTDFLNIAENQTFVIGKMVLDKRTYDPSESTDTKVKSGTQYSYKFAKAATATVNDVTNTTYSNIEVELSEGCIDVKFPLSEELTLTDSSNNALYVGQWQGDKWDISSVKQDNTQSDLTNLEACVSSFKTPFIAMEYKKQVTSSFSKIISTFILGIFVIFALF